MKSIKRKVKRIKKIFSIISNYEDKFMIFHENPEILGKKEF